MVGQRVRYPLSLLPSSPGGDWLGQSRFVPILTARPEEAGAMGRSWQSHRLLALQSQGMEHHQQSQWQVRTLIPLVPYLSKFHCITTDREEWGTQNERPQVPKIFSTRRCPAYGRSQHLMEIVSLAPSCQRILIIPLNALRQKNLRYHILFSSSLYSMLDQLWNPGYAVCSLPVYAWSKIPRI